MPQNISKYIIANLVLCLLVFSAQAQRKIPPHKEVKTDSINVNLYNGATIYGDVASAISSVIAKGETYSYEGAIQIDLRHKYYPILELGYAGADKTTSDNVGFNTNALFGRIGFDLNLEKNKKGSQPTNNLFQAGLRLGMSRFNYSITNMVITNDYWGGSETLPYTNLSTNKIWYEIVVGIRVEIAKNIFMGWSVRNKHLLNADTEGQQTPWYIPGFGKNTGGANTTINYVIGYHF